MDKIPKWEFYFENIQVKSVIHDFEGICQQNLTKVIQRVAANDVLDSRFHILSQDR